MTSISSIVSPIFATRQRLLQRPLRPITPTPATLAYDGEEYSGTAHYYAPKDPVSYRFSASSAEFNIVRVGLNYKFGG
jgi:hypothetical protein